jgi:HSP20 family protein
MSGLIRWTPFFDTFDEVEKAFSDLMPVLRSRGRQGGFVPMIDMYEDGDNIIVETQLAGIDPDKVEVAIENDVLTIKGESEKTQEVEDKNYYRKEIQRGSFYRSIPLPMHVDGDKAKAEAENGVLKITIPKAEEAKPKTIKVEKKSK